MIGCHTSKSPHRETVQMDLKELQDTEIGELKVINRTAKILDM